MDSVCWPVKTAGVGTLGVFKKPMSKQKLNSVHFSRLSLCIYEKFNCTKSPETADPVLPCIITC